MLLTSLPSLYYRLLKNDTATRILANPQLRTSEGIAAQARFGERVPVPVTTFAPIAAGGVQTQPITSFNYEPIGVNIDITPRMHHDDSVTLALKVDLSSISGKGFGDLPTFGSRQINTVIRLKDGETNMLAGLIRDEERTSMATIPGLGDIPVIGRLFAYNHKETLETDIILTLTPRIVRVLNLTAEDLQAFKVGRDGGAPLTDIAPPLPTAVAAARRRNRQATMRRRPRSPRVPGAGSRDADSTGAAVPVKPPKGPLDPRDRRAELLQPLDQPAVAALHRFERLDAALPVRDQRRGDQRHSRSNIAAVERLAAQLARPGHDDAMRIAEKQVGAHAAHLLERKQPQLIHPVVDQRRAVGLRRQHRDQADQVARKSRPQAGRDAAGADQLRRLDAEHVAVLLAVDVHLREDRRDHFHVDRPRAADVDVAAGDRADHRPTARLRCNRRRASCVAPFGLAMPSTRIVCDPSPLTPTPMPRRNSHSSTTCGSQAACRISDTPGAAAAASSAVSVPVTDASSR